MAMGREHREDGTSRAEEQPPRSHGAVHGGGGTVVIDEARSGQLDDQPYESEISKTSPFETGRVDLTPGASLGRYVILHGLGSGGMGVIYKAYDTELDRNVALKILRIAPDAKISAANARVAKLHRLGLLRFLCEETLDGGGRRYVYQAVE